MAEINIIEDVETPQDEEFIDEIPGGEEIPIEEDGGYEFKNLAKGMKKKRLAELAEIVVETYDNDEDSRADWLEKYKNWYRLLCVEPEHAKKDTPWEGASNIVLSNLTTSCYQFAARTNGVINSGKGIVKGYPVGKELSDLERASRVESHMNYQIEFKMPDYARGFSVSMANLPLAGMTIRKVYYDPSKNTNVADFISPENVCVNYYAKNIEDAKAITQIHLMDEIDYQRKVDAREYIKYDLSFTDSNDADDIGDVKDAENEIKGLQKPDKSRFEPRKVIEQHTWLQLEEEDKFKPFIVFVDYESKKILRITSRINPKITNPKDECYVMNYFVKYEFFPDANGSFYGMGFGALLYSAVEAMNSIFNQLSDSASLNNMQAGFTMKRSGMKRGDISFKMGEFKEIDLHVDDIRKAIMPFNFSPPSQTMFQLLGFLESNIEKVTTVSSALTGEMPSSDTGSMAVGMLLEQGLKMFSDIQRRVHESLQKELKLLYNLNGLYLDKPEYIEITTNREQKNYLEQTTGKPMTVEKLAGVIIIDDYSKPMDVRPVSDPNMVNKMEKAKKAEAVYQLVSSDPLLQGDVKSRFLALENYLQSLEINDTFINQILESAKEKVMLEEQQRQLMAQQQAQAQKDMQMLAKEQELGEQSQMLEEKVNQGMATMPPDQLARMVGDEIAAANAEAGMPA